MSGVSAGSFPVGVLPSALRNAQWMDVPAKPKSVTCAGLTASRLGISPLAASKVVPEQVGRAAGAVRITIGGGAPEA